MVDSKPLSGKKWWNDHKNQSAFKKSDKISDLEATFQSQVKEFKKGIEDAGAKISIDTTKRSLKRAHVLHYAWMIAKGQIKAKDVPAETGVDIAWDHGDDVTSKKAAQEIVMAANMASIASLTSNHIAGRAIDWSITWTGTLKIKQKDGTIKEITTTPRNGGDPGHKEFHAVGKGYGVHKGLFSKKDPPHWSPNGK